MTGATVRFFDLQVNGGYVPELGRGVDFSRPGLTVSDCELLAARVVAGGTAAFQPTAVTTDLAVLRPNLRTLARFLGTALGAHCPRLHLEGLFLNPTSGGIGAHPAAWCTRADVALLRELYECAEGKLGMLTVGADVEGIEDVIRAGVALGLVVCLGHHTATSEQIARAVAAGATWVTHFGNGCPPQVHRHYNPLSAQRANPRLGLTLIADGQHLPPDFIRETIAVKGPEGIVLVSDASSVAGAPPGDYSLGDVPVEVVPVGDTYKVAPRGERAILAGSWVFLPDCVRHLLGLRMVWEQEGGVSPLVTALSPLDVVAMASTRPLQVMGLTEEWFAALDGPGFCLVDGQLHGPE